MNMAPAPSDDATLRRTPILRADWKRLLIASWAIDPALAAPSLPRGIELARLRGAAHVSVVAFEFKRMRIRGVALPGLGDFPEVNIRTYVSGGGRRGVLFLREFAPHRLVVAGARLLYNEPYRYAAMRSGSRVEDDVIMVERRLQWRGAAIHARASALQAWRTPDESSDEHYFKEHAWGFGVDRRGESIVYRVRHARWRIATLRDWRIDVDWAGVMGPQWSALAGVAPDSVLLADGSWAEVYGKERIG